MVRVGDCDQDVEDIDEQEFSIKAVHFHPENNVGDYLDNDLAVVRLSSRVSHLLPFPRPGVHHLELGQHGPGQWRLLQETPGRQGAHPGDQALYGETGLRSTTQTNSLREFSVPAIWPGGCCGCLWWWWWWRWRDKVSYTHS